MLLKIRIEKVYDSKENAESTLTCICKIYLGSSQVGKIVLSHNKEEPNETFLNENEEANSFIFLDCHDQETFTISIRAYLKFGDSLEIVCTHANKFVSK